MPSSEWHAPVSRSPAATCAASVTTAVSASPAMSQSNGAPGSLKSSGRTETWWPQAAITASGQSSRARCASATAAVYCRADQQETTTRSASRSASSAPPICR